MAVFTCLRSAPSLLARAQDACDTAAYTTLTRRELQRASCDAAAPAIDVYTAFLGQGDRSQVLARAAAAMGVLHAMRPQPHGADGVRQSLVEALGRTCPSFLAALAFVRAQGQMHLCAAQMQSAHTGLRHRSMQAQAQELCQLWPERMLDERAAVRLAQCLTPQALETLTGRAGAAYVALRRVAQAHQEAWRTQAPSADEAAAPKLSAMARTRLHDIGLCLRLCGVDPLPSRLLPRFLIERRETPRIRAEQHRVLGHCAAVDVALLRRYLHSGGGRHATQQLRRLEAVRAQEIAQTIHEAQTEMMPHAVAGQLAWPRQISSATLLAKASMSTGLRR